MVAGNNLKENIMKLNNYVGRNIDEVQKEFKKSGGKCRVLVRDGQSYMVTMDYNPSRYNFSVEKDIITSVIKMG
jgi:predicted SpoU family rRNA methylase